MITLALITLLCLAALAGSSRAHRLSLHPAGELRTPLIHETFWLRGQLNRALEARCLPARSYRWRPAYRVPRQHRPWVVRQTRADLREARAAASRCNVVPWWPWGAIADCETGDRDGRPPSNARWKYDGPSGFDGGVQFHPDTWTAARRLVGVTYAYAYQAPAIVQVRVAQAWLAVTSWAQWPACSARLGLR